MTHATQLEAVLFAQGNMMDEASICRILGWSSQEYGEAVEELRRTLEGRGIHLQVWQDRLELVTIPEMALLVSSLREAEERHELSKPALETLAVFLYKGAITRPELEEVRGMYSHQILRSLLIKGLIEDTGQERIGQTVYDVTSRCLQWLGIAKRDDLPPLDPSLASDRS